MKKQIKNKYKMSNNRQIHTNTPNPEEGNKFTFKGKPKLYLI